MTTASVVGFDLGYQNCYVAVARSGGIETVANEFSDRCTASCLSFTDSMRFLGQSARQQVITNLQNTVHGFTKLLGKGYDDPDIQAELPYSPYKLVELDSGCVGVKVTYLKEQRVFRPQQLVAMMLTKLKLVAEAELGVAVSDCVLNTPSFFNDRQRRALLDAASIAGLNCLQLVSDTAAAALSYGIYLRDLPLPDAAPRVVCFVDMGHSQLQAALVAFNQGRMRVLATSGDPALGGRDLDRAIFNHFVEQFANDYNLDVRSSQRAQLKLMEECNKVKKLMSANSTDIPLSIDCLLNDKDVCGKINRSQFEQLLQAAGILRRIEDCLKQCLQAAGLHCSDLHSVEITGGSTRVPAVKRLIGDVLGHTPRTTLNADEAVARGCALQCAMLSPALRVRHFSLADCQPYCISLALGPGQMAEVFPAGHMFPFTRSLTFDLKAGQGDLDLIATYTDQHAVRQRDRQIGKYRLLLGNSGLTRSAKCRVKARINSHGLFCLTAADIIADEEQQQQQQQQQLGDSDEGNAGQTAAQLRIVASQEMQLPQDMLADFLRLEAEMQQQEADERLRCNLRNEVEELVYHLRDRISSDMRGLGTASERQRLQQELDSTEAWLYGEGESANQLQFKERLQVLRNTSERLICLAECAQALAELQQAVQRAAAAGHADSQAGSMCRQLAEAAQAEIMPAANHVAATADQLRRRCQQISAATEELVASFSAKPAPAT